MRPDGITMLARRLLALALLVAIVPMAGCWLPKAIGGMAESYRRTSTKDIPAEYEGLTGKSYAVLVYADRVLQGTHPQLTARLMNAITNGLAQPDRTGASGVVPVLLLIEFQLSHPDWIAWTYEQLVEEFDVDRLIVVELYEYRINEPGNAYLWSGVAAGHVGVVEADGTFPGEFAFSKDVQVQFPDSRGLGPNDMSGQQVRAQLQKRFIDRVTWLFYDHKEPYYPDY